MLNREFTSVGVACAALAVGNLPRYKCHKEVEALKIQSISNESPAQLTFVQTGGDVWYPPVSVPIQWVHKHNAQSGGYYVRYEDGYESWSPAAAFESGYTRIS